MKKLLLLLIFCSIIFSSCMDKREIEDNTFALLLGVDAAEDDLLVSIAFALTGVAKNEEKVEYTVVSAKASGIGEGLETLETNMSGNLALYSIKTLVISREIAESESFKDMFISWRKDEIRDTVNIIVSEGSAYEFIRERVKNPYADALKQEELLLEKNSTGTFSAPVQLLNLFIGMKSDKDGTAPYGVIIKENDEDKEEDAGDETEQESAGFDGQKSDISGLAVFRAGRMVGVLNSTEADLYSLLTKKDIKIYMSFQDPLNESGVIVISVTSKSAGKIKFDIKNGSPNFEITSDLIYKIESKIGGTDYTLPENLSILTAYVSQKLLEKIEPLVEKIQKEYSADLFGFENKAAKKFLTEKSLREFNFREKYESENINIILNLKYIYTGVIF